MFSSRVILTIVVIMLGVFAVSAYHPVKAEWKCVQDAALANAQGTKYAVACHLDPAGSFSTFDQCKEGCNSLCARGFKPSCNFTSVCKVYGFAINFMSVGAGLVALIVLLYGAYRYVMGKGEAEEISKAQAILINAGIGLVLVVVAYSLTRLVLALLQVDTVCF